MLQTVCSVNRQEAYFEKAGGMKASYKLFKTAHIFWN